MAEIRSGERWGALPLGELHAEGVCAYCGIKGPMCSGTHNEPEAVLKRTVHPVTVAVCHVCVDTVACERRRYAAKNP